MWNSLAFSRAPPRAARHGMPRCALWTFLLLPSSSLAIVHNRQRDGPAQCTCEPPFEFSGLSRGPSASRTFSLTARPWRVRPTIGSLRTGYSGMLPGVRTGGGGESESGWETRAQLHSGTVRAAVLAVCVCLSCARDRQSRCCLAASASARRLLAWRAKFDVFK